MLHKQLNQEVNYLGRSLKLQEQIQSEQKEAITRRLQDKILSGLELEKIKQEAQITINRLEEDNRQLRRKIHTKEDLALYKEARIMKEGDEFVNKLVKDSQQEIDQIIAQTSSSQQQIVNALTSKIKELEYRIGQDQ